MIIQGQGQAIATYGMAVGLIGFFALTVFWPQSHEGPEPRTVKNRRGPTPQEQAEAARLRLILNRVALDAPRLLDEVKDIVDHLGQIRHGPSGLSYVDRRIWTELNMVQVDRLVVADMTDWKKSPDLIEHMDVKVSIEGI